MFLDFFYHSFFLDNQNFSLDMTCLCWIFTAMIPSVPMYILVLCWTRIDLGFNNICLACLTWILTVDLFWLVVFAYWCVGYNVYVLILLYISYTTDMFWYCNYFDIFVYVLIMFCFLLMYITYTVDRVVMFHTFYQ